MHPRTSHEVVIVGRPLGLVLEEMDPSDRTHGVAIVGINEGGSAAIHNSGVFSKIRSKGDDDGGGIVDGCICIRDKIVSVNGTPCPNKGLDDVIDLIAKGEQEGLVLGLGRLEGSTVVNYYNGIW